LLLVVCSYTILFGATLVATEAFFQSALVFSKIALVFFQTALVFFQTALVFFQIALVFFQTAAVNTCFHLGSYQNSTKTIPVATDNYLLISLSGATVARVAHFLRARITRARDIYYKIGAQEFFPLPS
jgi:hypothetical protein